MIVGFEQGIINFIGRVLPLENKAIVFITTWFFIRILTKDMMLWFFQDYK